MKTWGSGDIASPINFCITGDWPASLFFRCSPTVRAPGTHWTGGWVGRGAGLEAVVKTETLPLLGTGMAQSV
jgi:hypothetical protein